MNRNHKIRHSKGFVIFVCVIASAITAAQERGYSAHDFGGTWMLEQANGVKVTMELQQSGFNITGKASYPAGRSGIMRGTVKGRVFIERSIDYFQVEITWAKNTGIYHGYTPAGRPFLVGETWPSDNPNGKVKWYTSAPGFPIRR